MSKFRGGLPKSFQSSRLSSFVKSVPFALAVCAMSMTSFAKGPHPGLSGLAASADNASTAGFNPAGSTRFNERTHYIEVHAFMPDNTWEGQVGENGPGFRLYDDDTTVVPSGNIIMPINDEYWFSFTVLGFALDENYGAWPGRYILEDYDLLYVSAFPSIAYKVNDKWSVAGSLQLTYTSYEQNSRVPNIESEYGDGFLNIDTDGFTLGFGLSALYEHSEQTRFGIVYRSELDPELDGNADFSNLSPTTEQLLDQAGLLGAPVDVESRTPQSLLVGMYHEFDNDHVLTADVIWSDFSRFKLSEIFVQGEQLGETNPSYDDIFAVSLGYSWPVHPRWRVGVAGMYADDMIADDQRTMKLRLDSLWAVGIGVEWQWTETRDVFFNLNYISPDDGPVAFSLADQGPQISGQYTDRETIWLSAAINF